MELIYVGLFVLGLVIVVAILKLGSLGITDEEILPYRLKQYFFSKSEQEFLRILNESIDRQKYIVFPKVRLADFIEVTVRGKEYQGWWNKIKSKHVDFLIWDIQNNKISLAIELDGNSHNSEKMQIRDEFVNNLYRKVGVQLERVHVGADFKEFAKTLSMC